MDRFLNHPSDHSFSPTKHQALPTTLKEPFRTVHISNLADDFYSNHLDWHQNTLMFVCENKIKLMDFYSNRITDLKSFGSATVTCVKFGSDGKCAIVGTSNGNLHIIDMCTKKTSKFNVHRSRIGTVEPKDNVLVTGSRDRQIKCMDMRSKHISFAVEKHVQEVCGVRMNRSATLLASGGNDNKVFVMEMRNLKKEIKICAHRAAVKAIDWSKGSDWMMVSGGGTADKIIRIWNVYGITNDNNENSSHMHMKRAHGLQSTSTTDKMLVKAQSFNSQVCNVYWSSTNKILSTHGYSKNDARISNLSLRTTNVMCSHKNRVIHFAVNERLGCFVTGSADNKLCFWRMEDFEDIGMWLR
ncbi:Anaphase promoting complex, Cdc20, Cdh1, and Ama1 subunits [Trachipleistophora hominis]|uniref:Anaphase promoting complex, Cdc20, Cdh1, and Ama1 subunits n=1 Tax=Trachipleistophora hominis TaxID=72359 RepID=L7JXV4_TRAHO|nr:Anaphase promoting complex, Cdc20, Cdh1, and Ama1 subunits [Trachipleistophora hominis]